VVVASHSLAGNLEESDSTFFLPFWQVHDILLALLRTPRQAWAKLQPDIRAEHLPHMHAMLESNLQFLEKVEHRPCFSLHSFLS
jgi:hypothetical protein